MLKFRAAFVATAALSLQACALFASPAGDSSVTIYPAEAIVLMTGEGDIAEAVAVKDGLILATGKEAQLKHQFQGARTDETFRTKTITPGLIDPHMHTLLSGLLYAHPFAPPWPMAMPDGMTEGYGSPEAFRARAAQIVAAAPPDGSAVVIYGFNNLIQGDLDRFVLDAIAPDRPVFVWHYSGHDFYLNSAALDLIGATPDLAKTYHGVDLTADGQLTGRIYEDAAMFVFAKAKDVLFDPASFAEGIERYFEIVRQAGVTTTADLGYGVFGLALEDSTIRASWSMEKDGFRLYLVPEYRSLIREFGDGAPQAVLDMASGLRPAAAPVLPRVKFFADAAYYSQTMRLTPPGYLAGQSKGTEGLWVIPEGEIAETMRPFVTAGLAAHIHSNGDAAQTSTLDALEALRSGGFSGDFVIEHGGLFSPQQAERAGRLGSMVSAASHYVFFLAEAYATPLGPARANWITPLGSLSEAGAIVAVHSDAPLAPPPARTSRGRPAKAARIRRPMPFAPMMRLRL